MSRRLPVNGGGNGCNCGDGDFLVNRRNKVVINLVFQEEEEEEEGEANAATAATKANQQRE